MTDPVIVVGNDGKYFQVCHWERFEGQLLDLSFVSTVYIYLVEKSDIPRDRESAQK